MESKSKKAEALNKWTIIKDYSTCYCGTTPNFDNASKANDTQCSSKCPADPSFACGSYNSVSLYKIDNPESSNEIEKSTARTPACYTSPLCGHQVCNTSLSISERVASLVNSLTEQEKILTWLMHLGAPSVLVFLPTRGGTKLLMVLAKPPVSNLTLCLPTSVTRPVFRVRFFLLPLLMMNSSSRLGRSLAKRVEPSATMASLVGTFGHLI